jgi:hypothetical protein
MVGVRFSINDFAGSSFFKALGSRPVGFNFRHYFFSFIPHIENPVPRARALDVKIDGVSCQTPAHATVTESI